MQLSVAIVTDRLQEINYHIDSTFLADTAVSPGLLYRGEHSGVIYIADCLDVDILTYGNGCISGMFNGKLTPDLDYVEAVPLC